MTKFKVGDKVTIPNSRLCSKYGGGEVTECTANKVVVTFKNGDYVGMYSPNDVYIAKPRLPTGMNTGNCQSGNM
ncbi:MAG: hypothetical protein COA78_22070 [Blastopirellula sp.]|nr:MAG: hypothetical protein COA78_22070 [Blastopirellula sp.]